MTSLKVVSAAGVFVLFAWPASTFSQDNARSSRSRSQKTEVRLRQLDTRVGTNEVDIINIRRDVRELDRSSNGLRKRFQEQSNDASARFLDLRERATQLESKVDGMQESAAKSQATLERVESGLRAQGGDLDALGSQAGNTKNELDGFWILISAALVFFMQAGFKALEVGMVRAEHRASIGIKNVLDWLVVSIAYYLVGFGLMYGTSSNGIVGLSLFAPNPATMPNEFKLEFFLFQLAFAGTAATIVSGALSERSALTSYLFSSVIISLVIYPLFGHWAWGAFYLENNEPWLAGLGFHDFAGGTVVHSIGAWVALVGVWWIGPRIGRFDPDVEATGRFRPSDLGYSILGVFILWVGWWGFNGGSVLAYDGKVSIVILNTNLAASAAGLVAFVHALTTDRANTFTKMIGGTLGGLVAITPCCDVVSSWDALVVGMLAGLVHNLAFTAMEYFRLDDPVAAVPVHGACGAFGTLAVGLFARQDQIEIFGLCADPTSSACVTPGIFAGGGFEQLLVQCVGVVVAFFLATTMAWMTFWFADSFIGLRVSEPYEQSGFAMLHGQEKDG